MIRIQALFSILLVSVIAILLSSCAPNLTVTILDAESADLHFSTNTTPLGSSLTRRFTGTDGKNGELYDRNAVSSSLSGMGIMLKSLSFPGGEGLDFSGSTQSLHASAPEVFTTTGSANNLAITLSPESVNAIMNRLPAETRDLLELLMAPVFTGEDLSADEYLAILAAAYGERAAAEIASSACTIYLKAPGKITSFRISGSNRERIQAAQGGNTASASIPLDLLLTLHETLTLTVFWD